MASFNRARYQIEIGDGWQAFSKPIPGRNMLGVVRVGSVEGALVRDVADGSFLLVRPGRVVTLLTHKVEAAIDARKAA
jgi:hypothetical protein